MDVELSLIPALTVVFLVAIVIILIRINRHLLYLMQDRSQWRTLKEIQYHVRMNGQVDVITPRGSYVFANLNRFNQFLKRTTYLA